MEGASEQGREIGGMGPRSASWLAWSLAGLALVLCAVSIALYVAARSGAVSQQLGHRRRQRRAHLPVALPRLPLGGRSDRLQAARKSDRWICLAAGIIWMVVLISTSYGVYGLVVRARHKRKL